MTARLSRWAAIPLILTLCAMLSIAPARATGQLGNSGKFVGWWELGGYYGTDESSRGEIVLFTPLAQSATTIFFLDARGKFFEEDVQEANLALGYRKMLPSGWNIGVWGGWDIRDTTNDNTFNQISFGFEALSERYDVRVNGYVPLEDSKGVSDTDTFEALLQGNNILVQGTNTDIDELAFYGVDAEFGILLFGGNRGGGGHKGAAPAGRHELRAYAGGFYFDNDDADDAIAGPKGRLEYRINDVVSGLPGSRLTIESELSYDEVRDTKFEIGARIRIPFGSRGSDAASRTASLTGQELRMIEGLERDTDIVTDEQTETTVTTESAIDDATNVALDNVSFAKTADQFAKAVNDGGNRLIIVQKGNKRIDVSATEGQKLQDNQTVQGGASTILIRGKKSGAVVPFTAPGKRPTIFTDDTNTDTGAITVANNTHVAGLNVRGDGGKNAVVVGNHGVLGGNNLDNVVLEQLDIRGMGDDGISFDDLNSNIRIWDSTSKDVGFDGVDFEDTNNNIQFYNVKVSDTGGDGIAVGDNNYKVWMKQVSVNGAGVQGIDIGSNNAKVNIYDTTIRNANTNGINIGIDNNNFVMTNLTIEDVTNFNGFNISNSNSNFRITNSTIRNLPGQGVRFGFDNSNIYLEKLNISDTGSDGIQFIDDNKNITIAYSEISKAGDDGIDFDEDNQNITVMDTRIRNARNNGVELNNRNDNVLFDNVQILDPDSSGISMNSDNTNVTFRNSIIDSPGNEGINMFANNRLKVISSTISDADLNGLNIGGAGNRITITDSTFSDFGVNALNVFGANTTIDINGTTFAGNIGQDILDIDNGGNVINGANNPNNANVGGFVCDGAGNFTGTITIGNETFVDSAGCN